MTPNVTPDVVTRLVDLMAVGFNAEQAEALATEGFGVVDVLAALLVDVEEAS